MHDATPIRLTIDAKHNAKWLTVTFDDDGPGIPEKNREDVFKPFFRLDEARNLDSQAPGLASPSRATSPAATAATSRSATARWAAFARSSAFRRECGMSIDITDMVWLNPPPSAEIRDGALHLRSAEKTDFWQGTYYGFHRDDGHFLHVARSCRLARPARVPPARSRRLRPRSPASALRNGTARSGAAES
jgi:hypothetical protein